MLQMSDLGINSRKNIFNVNVLKCKTASHWREMPSAPISAFNVTR
jgi:hypothetical protein